MNKFFISYLKGAKKSENTIIAYTSAVEKMLKYVNKPDTEINYFDLVDWKASISELSSATICQQIAAVDSYFKFLCDGGAIEKNPAEKLERPKVKSKQKEYLDADMVRAMIDNARTSRDKAIILTYVNTGMRVSELTSLTLEDYEELKVNGELVITGKGDKERSIFFGEEIIKVVDEYLADRGEDNCPYLFASFGKYGYRQQISPNHLSEMLKNTAKRAGIPFWNDVSNHWLRHSAASIRLENGENIKYVQTMLGHSNVATTSRYLHNNKAMFKEAMCKSVV